MLPIALLFAFVGAMHFLVPTFFLRIMPPWVPYPASAVALSGAAEIAGAIGLLVPAARTAAAWGLIVLLVAVFPANIHMLMEARATDAPALWQASCWLRLPLQPLLMWWVWKAGIQRH